MINSVTGKIQGKDLGITLMHEHIMYDDIGADFLDKNRYNKNQVVEVMLPYLNMLRKAGCRTLVDSTPPGEGRDIHLLKELSLKSGINIITNTGAFYGKGVCKKIRESSIEEIVEMWTRDFYKGIEGTGIKPGLIKIALDDGPISKLQEKILRAAAKTSILTNIPIQCHAFFPQTVLQGVEILREEKLSLSKFIWAHSDSNIDLNVILKLANQGMWIEIDSIGSIPYEKHIRLLKYLIQKGVKERLLISQDKCGYQVGKNKGGEIESYHKIFTEFIPECEKSGLEQTDIEEILVDNSRKCLEV